MTVSWPIPSINTEHSEKCELILLLQLLLLCNQLCIYLANAFMVRLAFVFVDLSLNHFFKALVLAVSELLKVGTPPHAGSTFPSTSHECHAVIVTVACS